MFWQFRHHIFGLCGAVLVSVKNSHIKLDSRTSVIAAGRACLNDFPG